MSVFRFTKGKIDNLPLPENRKQDYHYDTAVPGLGVCVGAGGAKTYFAEKRLKGKTRRITIGKHGVWVPDTVRDRARELLVDIDKGIDPNVVKKEKKAKATTLAVVFERFVRARPLKQKTIQVYTGALKRCFPEWLDKSITDISKDMIEQKYLQLLETKWERGTSGEAQAHQAMRTLRAILNYAQVTCEDSNGKSLLPENPVRRLTQAELWRSVPERDRYIKKQDLPAWYREVSRLPNTTQRDFLLLCLFSGLRRNEAAKIQWHHVNFHEKTLTIPAQNRKKVGKKPMKPLVLPLTSCLENLLSVRSDAAKLSKVRPIDNDFVFPGDGKGGHIVEVKNAIKRVTKYSNVDFSTHDLRRTFATVGESLVPYLALKRLIGHNTRADVTSAYVIADVERLREPAEKIVNYLMEHCVPQDHKEVPVNNTEILLTLVS